MAAKMTKRQYEKELAVLTANLENVRKQLAFMAETYITNVPEGVGLAWNNLHDAERELNEQIDELDTRFSRRNWTTQDYTSHSLVLDNIN